MNYIWCTTVSATIHMVKQNSQVLYVAHAIQLKELHLFGWNGVYHNKEILHRTTAEKLLQNHN